jgi:hypothetical protein
MKDMIRTPDNDIKDQNNETDDTTTDTIIHCVAVGFRFDGGRFGESEQQELEEHVESNLEHGWRI